MHRLILALILVAGFALRIWNIDYGLPFVYSVDEGSHFASRAVEMFWQDFDPGYYQNPAAYTYLVYGLLRIMYGPLGFLFDLPFANVTEQFAKDPSEIWIAARTLAALLCMAGVLATYWAARRLWGVREGLVAAALLSFAFLPVAYSRVAVTDVGALAGVALALLWAARAADEGRTRDYALAGAAAGLAISFKYTAGLVLLPLGIAALARLRADGLRAVGGLALGGALAALVFLLLNPYVFGSLDEWWTDLRDQADVAANDRKPGQASGGFGYYLDSLTWGLGWAALAAALVGAVVELRRDIVRGLILIAFPLALFAYLATQSRYFGRWLLPAYPALALLGAVGLTQAGDSADAPRRRQPPAPAAAGRRGRRARRADRARAHPAARRGRAQRPGAGARGHAEPGARVARRALPARAARGGRAGRARTLVPLDAGGQPTRPGCRAARAATTGRSPAGPTPARAGGGSARSTSRASSLGPTAACARPRTTRCSRPM